MLHCNEKGNKNAVRERFHTGYIIPYSALSSMQFFGGPAGVKTGMHSTAEGCGARFVRFLQKNECYFV